MQSLKKCLKQFEYFKSKLKPSGLLFFQETRSTIDCKKSGRMEGDLDFSHGSSNYWAVLIAFYGNQDNSSFKKNWQKRTSPCFRCTDWRLWILFINIHNADTEKEQVNVLNELTTIMSNFEIIYNLNVVFVFWYIF